MGLSELYTFGHERASQQDGIDSIDAQHGDRGATNGRLPHQLRPRPSKVITPDVSPRIEQPRHFSSFLIQSCQIRSLVRVAAKAGPAKILQLRDATVFLCNDMVGLKSQLGHRLRQVAILTAKASASSDLAAQTRTHRR